MIFREIKTMYNLNKQINKAVSSSQFVALDAQYASMLESVMNEILIDD
jgi:hypothetical protein